MQLFGSHKPSPEVPSLSDPCAGSVPSNGLPGSVLHSGRKKALLIGINYYGTKAQLRGCAPTPASCWVPSASVGSIGSGPAVFLGGCPNLGGKPDPPQCKSPGGRWQDLMTLGEGDFKSFFGVVSTAFNCPFIVHNIHPGMNIFLWTMPTPSTHLF